MTYKTGSNTTNGTVTSDAGAPRRGAAPARRILWFCAGLAAELLAVGVTVYVAVMAASLTGSTPEARFTVAAVMAYLGGRVTYWVLGLRQAARAAWSDSQRRRELDQLSRRLDQLERRLLSRGPATPVARGWFAGGRRRT